MDGYYVFLLESVDDVIFLVDDQVLLKGKEKAYNRRQSYVLPLAKGSHAFKLTFLQNKNTGKPNFIVYQDKLKEEDYWWDNELLNL